MCSTGTLCLRTPAVRGIVYERAAAAHYMQYAKERNYIQYGGAYRFRIHATGGGQVPGITSTRPDALLKFGGDLREMIGNPLLGLGGVPCTDGVHNNVVRRVLVGYHPET